MSCSVLAIKAINQYRRRDVIPYLGLRYYLDNLSARRDRWILEISCKITLRQQNPPYLKAYHFKDVLDQGGYEHRDMHFPSPNEALAETALINELAKHNNFKPQSYVYSYRFADEEDCSGVFKPYFSGFKERQKAIALACREDSNAVVLYTDIKKFYPNIHSGDALRVWREYSHDSPLSDEYIQLGEKLLENHKVICDDGGIARGVLTGPQFSHVIANLLLDKIDQQMYQLTNGNYWRYVDDIVLLGSDHDICCWKTKLEELLGIFKLELHTGEKDFRVSSKDWLEGENDFDSLIHCDWVSLIADTKRFLLANSSVAAKEELTKEFRKNNIRLPLLDYSQAVKESSSVQRFNDWFRRYNINNWSLKIVNRINPESLLKLASVSKKILQSNLDDILSKPMPNTLYERKRVVPKLRFLVGRLVFLLDSEQLIEVVEKLSDYPELNLLTCIMRAIATRDVTEVLKMGSNATQAAAQLLRVIDEPVVFHIDQIDVVTEQSLAILTCNGISFQCDFESSELRQFSQAQNISSLMSSENAFIQEVACLHGIGKSRHSMLLDQAFDRDEEPVLDIITQLQNSSHS